MFTLQCLLESAASCVAVLLVSCRMNRLLSFSSNFSYFPLNGDDFNLMYTLYIGNGELYICMYFEIHKKYTFTFNLSGDIFRRFVYRINLL